MEQIKYVFWFLGISFSVVCLLAQMFIYIVLPLSRKLDQKILTHLTVARLLNSIIEYLILRLKTTSLPILRDVIFAVYLQTDTALFCWMFFFTKILYFKMVQEVFAMNDKISFILVSVTIWLGTLLIGILCPVFLNIDLHNRKNGRDTKHFVMFYDVYGIVKFIILTINLLFFCRIFWVAMKMKTERDVNVKGVLKTCLVSFILVSITSLQVLLTDFSSYFLNKYEQLNLDFKVINSFQVLAITTIFVILTKGICKDSLGKTLILKCQRLMA